MAEYRLSAEQSFHDKWANTESPESIDVVNMAESCTAPEMRAIVQALGNISGKKLLDLGCGFGEASVYFALQNANVTAADISPRMLDATLQVAKRYGVTVDTVLIFSEGLRSSNLGFFDIVYLGNLLHHVENVDITLRDLVGLLKKDGVLVSWDPLAYNPIINVYRKIATDVRTECEHPLRKRDLQSFRKYFASVETKWFWLTTLSIFLIMRFVLWMNPNKVRFWKAVVEQGAKWKWLYWPLAKLDSFLIRLVPPLRFLCWNVVVIARRPCAGV